MRSGSARPSTRTQRQALAFVVVSLLAHGSLLAALSLVQLSHGGAPARADHDDDPFLMTLTLRSTPFLVQSQPEPVAQPIPEPVPDLPVEVDPELAPEPAPAPQAPPTPVATTTAEEALTQATNKKPEEPPLIAAPTPPTAEPPAESTAAPASAPVPAPAAPAAVPSDRREGGSAGNGALDDALHLRALRTDRPEYPEEARRRNEEGTVTCRLTIDSDGRVIEVEVILSSGSKALDAAATRTLKRWRFEPPARLTDRKSVHALQKLTFELKSARR